MARAVVLGVTIYGCCVDSHGVRGCGIEDCCDGMIHVKNVMSVVLSSWFLSIC